jgi:hypothetical protein
MKYEIFNMVVLVKTGTFARQQINNEVNGVRKKRTRMSLKHASWPSPSGSTTLHFDLKVT